MARRHIRTVGFESVGHILMATRILAWAFLTSVVWAVSGAAQQKPPADSSVRQPDSARASEMPGMHDMPGMPGMSHHDGLMRMPPMGKGLTMKMLPGMERAVPTTALYLPGADLDPLSLTAAVPSKLVALKDGDTLALTAMLVRRTIHGKAHVMYGFNGQYPGPLIRVAQNTTVYVKYTNRLDMPSTVHWHGVRLDNRFDGAAGVTQAAVPPGSTFVYTVHFPDAGIYWYHPHVREDIQQELGLYGNMVVDSPEPGYYSPVNDEEFLILDDLLLDDRGILPFGKTAANYAIMGRFGNVFMINGEPDYHLTVHKGDVVRFFLTNASNSRMYNLSFDEAPIKLVAAGLGRFENEEMVPGVVIGAAQRYVAEVRFDSVGTFAITNRVQALNNFLGTFFPEVDTLGLVTVTSERSEKQYGKQFETLRENKDVKADIERYRKYFDRAPDKNLMLSVNIQGMPLAAVSLMSLDTMYFPPAEWNDGMPDMNWVATTNEVHWIIKDLDSGKENMGIDDWHFKVGDVVKIRITNDAKSMHPMSHPIHFHGQRLLVLSRNGVRASNLAWRDTFIVPVGETVDILVEMTNPGKWMAHCHIAEHLASGMDMIFTVGS
jgi:FtsP/CotA-like multicopper oxidase with cupredoxin domain